LARRRRHCKPVYDGEHAAIVGVQRPTATKISLRAKFSRGFPGIYLSFGQSKAGSSVGSEGIVPSTRPFRTLGSFSAQNNTISELVRMIPFIFPVVSNRSIVRSASRVTVAPQMTSRARERLFPLDASPVGNAKFDSFYVVAPGQPAAFVDLSDSELSLLRYK
jgi:hypothetical protein